MSTCSRCGRHWPAMSCHVCGPQVGDESPAKSPTPETDATIAADWNAINDDSVTSAAYWRMANLCREIEARSVNADDVRMALGGHRCSELFGEHGLIAATMRALDYYDDREADGNVLTSATDNLALDEAITLLRKRHDEEIKAMEAKAEARAISRRQFKSLAEFLYHFHDSDPTKLASFITPEKGEDPIFDPDKRPFGRDELLKVAQLLTNTANAIN